MINKLKSFFDTELWYYDISVTNEFSKFRNLLNKSCVLNVDEKKYIGLSFSGNVYISDSAVIHPNTVIYGPAWIGDNCELGPNCYIRPFTILESDIRIGFSVEVKESIIGHGTTISHLAYIGNSIIGRNVMLGAGFCAAVERLDSQNIYLKSFKKNIKTNFNKLGAIIGDGTRIGVYTKLMPGVVVGKDCHIGPNKGINECILNTTKLY